MKQFNRSNVRNMQFVNYIHILVCVLQQLKSFKYIIVAEESIFIISIFFKNKSLS